MYHCVVYVCFLLHIVRNFANAAAETESCVDHNLHTAFLLMTQGVSLRSLTALTTPIQLNSLITGQVVPSKFHSRRVEELVYSFELANEWVLLPQRVRLLVGPVRTLWTQLEIKVVEDLCYDEAHFVICHTKHIKSGLASRSRPSRCRLTSYPHSLGFQC
jgi:hypothetical protein